MPTLYEVRRNIAKQLANAGMLHPFDEAKWLVCTALNIDPGLALTSGETIITEDQYIIITDYLKRRIKGEPLSRIHGEREFWSLPFELNDATLDPRADSETIVEAALEHIPQSQSYACLDLGTGTGCLLISLLHERPLCYGVGVDASPEASCQAHKNSIRNKVENRTVFITSSWTDALPNSTFDFIVANPPYIPSSEIMSLENNVRDYDPLLALDGGRDGLNCYREIIPQIQRVLKPEGVCIFEIGFNQAVAVQALCRDSGFDNSRIIKDLAGLDRGIVLNSKF